MLLFCVVVALFLLAVLGMAVYTSFIKFWPYDKSLSLRHYTFGLIDGGVISSFFNSLKMAIFSAVFGTMFIFGVAYLLEKTRGMAPLKSVVRLLAAIPMAVPGMVLGLGYILFFNEPSNPLNPLYGTLSILVLSTIVHYYTSSHLTAVTALKALDNEFESVSSSLKVPFYKTFFRVTVPGVPARDPGHRPLHVRQRDGDDLRRRVPVSARRRSWRRSRSSTWTTPARSARPPRWRR